MRVRGGGVRVEVYRRYARLTTMGYCFSELLIPYSECCGMLLFYDSLLIVACLYTFDIRRMKCNAHGALAALIIGRLEGSVQSQNISIKVCDALMRRLQWAKTMTL